MVGKYDMMLTLLISSSCQHKDSRKPLSLATMNPSPPSGSPSTTSLAWPTSQASNNNDNKIQDAAVRLIPADFQDAETDLDPTEWKPKIQRAARMMVGSSSSEAWRYLSQFYDEAPISLPALSVASSASSSSSSSSSEQAPLPPRGKPDHHAPVSKGLDLVDRCDVVS